MTLPWCFIWQVSSIFSSNNSHVHVKECSSHVQKGMKMKNRCVKKLNCESWLASFLPQVATANLAWASVAIHQVQVSKCHQRTPLSSVVHTLFSVTNEVNSSCPVLGYFVCSGSALVFSMGKIHCVQELGCQWAQSNQLSHTSNKQLPKDVIMAQRCFYMNRLHLRGVFPLQHWPQWTTEPRRAVRHGRVSCSVKIPCC